MHPTPVILDEPTAAKLAAAANGQPVPIHNPAGQVIGYLFTPAQKAKADERQAKINAWLDEAWPAEEIARIKERRKNDPRPNIPHEEVLRMGGGPMTGPVLVGRVERSARTARPAIGAPAGLAVLADRSTRPTRRHDRVPPTG